PFIEECVVRPDQIEHAAILAQHAVEEEFGFLPEGLSQVVIEVPKKSSVRSDGFDIAQPQPLSSEIRSDVERASIGKHPARLLLEFAGLTQFAMNSGIQQFIIWDAAPQKKRKSRCQFEIADPVDTVRCNFFGVAFDAEQEVRVDEHSTQCLFDSGFEIAFCTPFAIERHRLINFSFGNRPPIRTPHQCRQNLSCTLILLVFVLSGWPASKQPSLTCCA